MPTYLTEDPARPTMGTDSVDAKSHDQATRVTEYKGLRVAGELIAEAPYSPPQSPSPASREGVYRAP